MTTRVQGQRDVALSSLPFRGIAINDDTNNTAAVQVYASDSGILFIQKNTATTTYTLPVVGDCKGKIFFFFSYVEQDLVITGGTTDKMVGGDTTAVVDADKVTLGTNRLGGWAIIVGDGSNYYALTGTGTWSGSG